MWFIYHWKWKPIKNQTAMKSLDSTHISACSHQTAFEGFWNLGYDAPTDSCDSSSLDRNRLELLLYLRLWRNDNLKTTKHKTYIYILNGWKRRQCNFLRKRKYNADISVQWMKKHERENEKSKVMKVKTESDQKQTNLSNRFFEHI